MADKGNAHSHPGDAAGGPQTETADVLKRLADKKKRGEPIVMLTAYDAPLADIIEKTGVVDLVLVGDSLGMVVQGKSSTRDVTLDQMRYHTGMVCSAAHTTPVIADLPYHTFDSAEEALTNARTLVKAGAWGVKFEGGNLEAAAAIVDAGIPLMAHLGLLPQTAKSFSVRGKDREEAEAIIRDAEALEQTGVFSLVLESIPRALAQEITKRLTIPTIGIGAGPDCDGQVLVSYDMIGLTRGRVPKFVKKYADTGSSIEEAVRSYAREVREREFPSDAHSYH